MLSAVSATLVICVKRHTEPYPNANWWKHLLQRKHLILISLFLLQKQWSLVYFGVVVVPCTLHCRIDPLVTLHNPYCCLTTLSNIVTLICCKNIWRDKQRFLTPGHQGWNDLHSLCRIGMEYYLLNNDDNNIIYWIMMIIMIMMMMIIIMIIMMTMMIIGTATIMIMIIIITTTLTMTIMKMIMIKTAQTPCQSLYQDRRI